MAWLSRPHLRKSPRDKKQDDQVSLPTGAPPGRVRRRKRRFPSGPRRQWQRMRLVAAAAAMFCLIWVAIRRQQLSSDSDQFQVRLEGLAPCPDEWYSVDEIQFTLVTQFSMDRAWMMEHHCQRWKGPMAVAVYTNDSVASVKRQLTDAGCLDIQVTTLLGDVSAEDYPVNALRNAALQMVQTSHAVYLDIDFFPSVDLKPTLEHHRSVLSLDRKAALLVPAFQLNRQCEEWTDCRKENLEAMPSDQEDLIHLLEARKADPFDPTNRGGHGSTRYADWLDQEGTLEIDCFQSNRFEPYLAFGVCRDVLPPFQTAFTGYGKNKMTWVMQLRHAGWRFWQVPDSFLIHYPHLDSVARMHWNGGEGGVQLPKPVAPPDWLALKRGRIDATFVAFKAWLAHTSDNNQQRVPLCEDAMHDDAKLWIARDEKA